MEDVLSKYAPKEEHNEEESQETNVTEDKQEEVVEDSKREQAESKPAEPSNEGTDVDVSQLKEILGVEELTIDDIKSRYTGWEDLSTKAKQYEEDLKAREEELNSYKSFAEQAVDPETLFANETMRSLNNVLKKYPELDSSVASKLVSNDAKELSDIDAIAIAEAMENADYGLRADEAELKLLKRLGIESRDELEELSSTDRRLLEVDARKARALIAREQAAVNEAPEKQSPDEFIQKHKESVKEQVESSRKAYEPIIDDIIGKVEGEIEHKGQKLFELKLDDAYKKEVRDFALEQIGNFRMGADDKSKEQVLENIRTKVFGDKMGEILQAARSEERTMVTQELEQKYNNHKPLDTKREATPEDKDSGISSIISSIPKTSWGNL